jgi:hypothetical protein
LPDGVLPNTVSSAGLTHVFPARIARR